MPININFSSDVVTGTTPLKVMFTANVTFSQNLSNRLKIKEYIWYFDFDNNPLVYETTTSPIIYHIYNGKNGDTKSVRLEVEIEPK